MGYYDYGKQFSGGPIPPSTQDPVEMAFDTLRQGAQAHDIASRNEAELNRRMDMPAKNVLYPYLIYTYVTIAVAKLVVVVGISLYFLLSRNWFDTPTSILVGFIIVGSVVTFVSVIYVTPDVNKARRMLIAKTGFAPADFTQTGVMYEVKHMAVPRGSGGGIMHMELTNRKKLNLDMIPEGTKITRQTFAPQRKYHIAVTMNATFIGLTLAGAIVLMLGSALYYREKQHDSAIMIVLLVGTILLTVFAVWMWWKKRVRIFARYDPFHLKDEPSAQVPPPAPQPMQALPPTLQELPSPDPDSVYIMPGLTYNELDFLRSRTAINTMDDDNFFPLLLRMSQIQ